MEIPEYFSSIKDFRVLGRCLHELGDILGLVLCGVIADCDDFSQIADYGETNIAFLQAELGFGLANGIPSEDTLLRVMSGVNPVELEKSYSCILKSLRLSGKQLCIDSKELRGTIPAGRKHSLVRMVNVWVEQDSLSFGQVKIDSKSNEVTAIPVLLNAIDCQGSLVSIDAMGCQKKIVSLIREKKADYLIAVKANQGNLYEQLSTYMLANYEQLPCHTTRDKDHGRAERRKVYVACCPEVIGVRDLWTDLASLIMVERIRICKGKQQIHRAFYISSLKNNQPEVFANHIRKHWAVESQLHWQLDISFREDQSRVRKDHAPVNLHLIRKWTLHLIKNHSDKKGSKEISIKRKRKKALSDKNYLKAIIYS